MPYIVERLGNKWIVRKKWFPYGRTYGVHISKEHAEAQVRAIEANEHRKS